MSHFSNTSLSFFFFATRGVASLPTHLPPLHLNFQIPSRNHTNPSLSLSFILQRSIHIIRRMRSWFRHCATNRKVAGSIPDWIIEIFQWHSPSSRTVALGSTQPLTYIWVPGISPSIHISPALLFQIQIWDYKFILSLLFFISLSWNIIKQKFHYLSYITVWVGHQLSLPVCL
jgi:hypothetical protein